MYSQRDEEVTILKHAPEKGRFLDVGAFHFKTFSNTRALYERGWNGCLVEPSPECFVGLMQEYGGNPRIQLVNALLTKNSEALTEFHSSPDAVGTCNQSNYAKWAKHAKFTTIYVPSLPVNKLIAALDLKADFVSIDAEGESFDLLKEIDLDRLQCNLVCVEIDNHGIEVSRWFAARNFSVIACTGENFIAKRNG